MDTFKKKVLALSALPLAFVFVAAFQLSDSVPSQLKAILSRISGLEFDINGLQSQISSLEAQVASLANKGQRKFYVTRDRYFGDQALTACAAGYHMASLWEILDPSNLRYDTELGQTLADSGFGPPSWNAFAQGWIRTGFFGHDAPPPGQASCDAWTSRSPGEQGTVVNLNSNWTGAAASAINPWVAEFAACASGVRVWCVQD